VRSQQVDRAQGQWPVRVISEVGNEEVMSGLVLLGYAGDLFTWDPLWASPILVPVPRPIIGRAGRSWCCLVCAFGFGSLAEDFGRSGLLGARSKTLAMVFPQTFGQGLAEGFPAPAASTSSNHHQYNVMPDVTAVFGMDNIYCCISISNYASPNKYLINNDNISRLEALTSLVSAACWQSSHLTS
jgi:hypothetical protein